MRRRTGRRRSSIAAALLNQPGMPGAFEPESDTAVVRKLLQEFELMRKASTEGGGERYSSDVARHAGLSLLDLMTRSKAETRQVVLAWAVGQRLRKMPEKSHTRSSMHCREIQALSAGAQVHTSISNSVTSALPTHVPVQFMMDVVTELVSDTRKLKKMARTGLLVRLGSALLISFSDLVTDILVIKSFLSTPGMESFGTSGLVCMAVAQLTHAYLAWTFGQGWRGALLGFIGLKPFFESWAVLNESPKPKGHAFPAHLMLMASRITEVCLESVRTP